LLIFNDENECFIKHETEISSAKSENKAYMVFASFYNNHVLEVESLYPRNADIKKQKIQVSISPNPIN